MQKATGLGYSKIITLLCKECLVISFSTKAGIFDLDFIERLNLTVRKRLIARLKMAIEKNTNIVF